MAEQFPKYRLSHFVVRLVAGINFAHLLLMYYQPYFRAVRNIFRQGGDVYSMMISARYDLLSALFSPGRASCLRDQELGLWLELVARLCVFRQPVVGGAVSRRQLGP